MLYKPFSGIGKKELIDIFNRKLATRVRVPATRTFCWIKRGVNTNNCWFNAWWTYVRMIQFWSLSWPTASWHIPSPTATATMSGAVSKHICQTLPNWSRWWKTQENTGQFCCVSGKTTHINTETVFIYWCGYQKVCFFCSGVMSQYLDRRLKLNANICTICKSFNTCVFCNMLTLTMCFVFVYRYGKFRGRGTGSSRIPRRRSRNTSAWHSLFPSTTGYLVQRRTQNPSQQSDVSLFGFLFPIPPLFYRSFSFLYVIVFEGYL